MRTSEVLRESFLAFKLSIYMIFFFNPLIHFCPYPNAATRPLPCTILLQIQLSCIGWRCWWEGLLLLKQCWIFKYISLHIFVPTPVVSSSHSFTVQVKSQAPFSLSFYRLTSKYFRVKFSSHLSRVLDFFFFTLSFQYWLPPSAYTISLLVHTFMFFRGVANHFLFFLLPPGPCSVLSSIMPCSRVLKLVFPLFSPFLHWYSSSTKFFLFYVSPVLAVHCSRLLIFLQPLFFLSSSPCVLKIFLTLLSPFLPSYSSPSTNLSPSYFPPFLTVHCPRLLLFFLPLYFFFPLWSLCTVFYLTLFSPCLYSYISSTIFFLFLFPLFPCCILPSSTNVFPLLHCPCV